MAARRNEGCIAGISGRDIWLGNTRNECKEKECEPNVHTCPLDCEIKLNGQPAKISELANGDKCVIFYRGNDVSKVDATRKG